MSESASILCTGHVEIPDEFRAATNGIAIDVIPFIEVYPISDESTITSIRELMPETCVVVFTSFNAVAAVASCVDSLPKGWTIYCLNGKTRDVVVQHFGEKQIKGVAPDSATLARTIINHGIQEVVFFCGNIRMDTLPILLGEAGILVKEIIVYFTDTQTTVVGNHYEAILFFSPSGVRGYFLHNTPFAETIMYAIGHTTAAEIEKYCTNKVIVAPTPSKIVMLQMAAQGVKDTKQITR